MQKSSTITELTHAVIAVMKQVKGVEKNAKVGSGNYGYSGVSDQDVKKVVGEAMAENGLCILPTDIAPRAEVTRWQEGTSSKQQVFTEVTTKYILMHTSGEWAEVCGYGQGVDSQDKSAGKATTYGLKYLLLYMFLVPTGAIDDADTTHSAEIVTPKVVTKPTMSAEIFESTKASMIAASSDPTIRSAKDTFAAADKAMNMTPAQKAELSKLIK